VVDPARVVASIEAGPAMANPPAASAASARYPLVLLGLFLAWWTALAIAPHYREDWWLENVMVFIAIPLLTLNYRNLRFSNGAYTCLFVFFFLHAIGAYYTYAEVPYDRWMQAISGHRLNDLLGLERNHFDRLVHFLYGLLVTPAVMELLDVRTPQRGMWRWLLPWFVMVSQGSIFEIVEAAAAGIFGGDLGQAYLGTQGDVWDAHKDSALAALGATIVVIWYRWKPRVGATVGYRGTAH
jgi:putative membrane protein